MQPAGARALRADDNTETYSDREAVLSAWEQKSMVDDFPLRTRRFQRSSERASVTPTPQPRAPERRTVTITGHPTPPRARRRSAAQQHLVAQPDRVALWAFLLGLFLVFVAAATANAAPL
jgi:thiol:disulfide interchange protein